MGGKEREQRLAESGAVTRRYGHVVGLEATDLRGYFFDTRDPEAPITLCPPAGTDTEEGAACRRVGSYWSPIEDEVSRVYALEPTIDHVVPAEVVLTSEGLSATPVTANAPRSST